MEFELARDFFKTPPGPPPKTPPALPLSWQPLATGLSGCLEDYDQQSQDSQSSQAAKAPTNYEEWLRVWFPAYVSTLDGASIPLADHHHEFWKWVWSLKRGVRPPPFVAIWPRGGGKSTSAELACVAVGARRSRRYVLYVSSTQAQADDHVSNVASLLESASVEQHDPALADRAVGKYGSSRGWRRNRLRTAAGFTVDAIGLDTAARGVKLDEARPDLLVLDDIDDAVDSSDTIRKKIVAITQKLLPAGSTDAGTLAVQNLIHHEGVFARLAGLSSEPADFLADRIVSGPHPALRGFQAEKQSDGKWKILSGSPTWAGQDIDTCQRQINDWGLKAFRAEAQHERTPPDGQAFPEFDVSVHTVEPFKVPETWPRWRSVDYGYAVPYAHGWFTRSPSGTIYLYRERYGKRKTAADQAYEMRLASAGEKFFVSVGDPAMWASNREGHKVQSVADQYGEMGIGLTPATNQRLAGKALVHRALEYGTNAPPTFLIFKTCHNTIRTLPLLPVDKDKPEDVDTTAEDHCYDMIRYGLQAAPWLEAMKRSKPQSFTVGARKR